MHYKIIKKTFISIILFFSLLIPSQAKHAETLKIAIYTDGGSHRIKVHQSLKQFEKNNPDVHVKLIALRGVDEYNYKFYEWMAKEQGPDILFWYGGERIRQLSKQGKIKDLTSLWYKNKLNSFYPTSVNQAITVNKRIYAIPNTVLLWALYYNQNLFDQFKLPPPSTWQDLLKACNVFRKNEIDLFSIGTKGSSWVTHGWFDYLNLRLNGIEFYYQLTEGKISYQDDRVRNIFTHWKTLIDKGCFNADYNQYSIWEAFPKVLRGYSAISLLDGIPTGVSNINKYNIKLIEFPVINPIHDLYTVQPINVFIVPSYAKMTKNLEKLLVHISSEDFQTLFNDAVNKTSSHIHSNHRDEPLINKAKEIIFNSPQSVQYFDRETNIAFSGLSPAILVEFINNTDIELTLSKLEALRKKTFNLNLN